MDPTYQARAFFGGPTGPNYPSPRGLLDILGWQQMDPGEAAQAVEVSAYPDRYRNYAPVADSILDALTNGGSAPVSVGGPAVSSSRVVFPLPEGTWVLTSPFGMRVHPITGERKMHTGTDFAAPMARRSSPPPTAPSPSRSPPAGTAASSSSSTPSTARPSRPLTRTCGRAASTSVPVTA